MLHIRLATEADAAIIALQRVKMFQDNNLVPVGTWEQLERDSLEWTARKMREGSYVGWLVEEEDANGAAGPARVIGGAGVWFMEWPPHWMHPEPKRGYLLNVYIAPEARRRGLARKLVLLATDECKRRGLHLAVLHASQMGQPIYEELGWKMSNEMVLKLK